MKLALFSAAAIVSTASAGWTVVANDVATVSTGIAVNEDGSKVFLVGGSNGVGAQILESTDGGHTWNETPSKPGIMFMDITASGDNGIFATGAFEEEYSNDEGKTWGVSSNPAMDSQCARNFPSGGSLPGFAAVGEWGFNNTTEAVGISVNGGQNITAIPVAAARTPVRYGAFPTTNTWYISAGQWPSNSDDDHKESGRKQLTGRLAVVEGTDGKHRYDFTNVVSGTARTKPLLRAGADQSGSSSNYMAQILKTTNGGKTFTSLYSSVGQFYPNGIDCLSETNCCVALENDDSAPSGNIYPGATIMCTQDGHTFTTRYQNTTVGMSFLDLRAVGNNGYVAAGGIIGQFGPGLAKFLYSADGGNTWQDDGDIPNYFAPAVECSQTAECWAPVLSPLQVASIAYTNKA